MGDVKHTLVHTARARGFTEGKSRPVCLYTYVYLMVCASDLPAFSHNIVVKQPFRGSFCRLCRIDLHFPAPAWRPSASLKFTILHIPSTDLPPAAHLCLLLARLIRYVRHLHCPGRSHRRPAEEPSYVYHRYSGWGYSFHARLLPLPDSVRRPRRPRRRYPRNQHPLLPVAHSCGWPIVYYLQREIHPADAWPCSSLCPYCVYVY